ncbi:aldehyde dehydrogenase family protein [Butyricicoccus faecihominis]|uniref:aldehyde dehydrogenase family protein n=1 Tax=Butyricicoccaceae TaxID=3085642 RepID=UPI0024786D6D|nr:MULTISPECIES: aldehyde dehydrogenase family protein [Butyricicoccaceae]MCQ5130086.1 aldehyde dehydrogenase family protein [Butyricicoccus faecihominis]WNX85498.1 aldehyde dehydrogenase family protein [Agathobaculum sp. NTUH-O15-33]
MKMQNVIDESTGKLVGSVPRYTGEEIAEMVDIAFDAQPRWENSPLFERGQILYKLCDKIDENIDEIANYMACEMGKPIMQARAEVTYAAEIGRNNIEYGKHMFGRVLCDSSEGHENDVVMVRHEALGVIAAVIPFNYPVELTIQKIVPALLMGNAVIVKASTTAPCSVKKLIDLAHEVGVPKDVLHYVTASREDCTKNLLTNKKVACLALTGSNDAGTEIMHDAAPTIKKVVLELGGNDPLIIREDVAGDSEQMLKAIECLGWGRILENNGQVCASPKRTLVHKKAHDAFVECLLTFVKSLKRGHATDPEAQLTRLVSSTAAERVAAQIQHTIDQGATLLYGGTHDGAAMDVTILDNVTKDMDIAKDMEVFGPVVPIITFETDEEAVAIANQSKYGLSSCVITQDMHKAFYYAEAIESSAVWVNGSSALRHNDQPFGGCKGTGIGNEGAGYSCEEFTRRKTIGFRNVSPKQHLFQHQDGTGAVLADVRKIVEKVVK